MRDDVALSIGDRDRGFRLPLCGHVEAPFAHPALSRQQAARLLQIGDGETGHDALDARRQSDQDRESARHFGEVGQGHRVHRREVIPHPATVAQRHSAPAGLQLCDAGADRAGVRSQPAHEQTEERLAARELGEPAPGRAESFAGRGDGGGHGIECSLSCHHMTQLAFAGVGVDFGDTTLFSTVSFTVAPGERWGIVGRNGSGKTTLFRLLTGELEPTRGSIARASRLRVSLLEQHRDFGAATTVWEAAAGELAELLALEQSLVQQAADLAHDSSPRALTRYGEDLERFEHEGGYAVTSRIDAVLHGLGFDPEGARATPVGALSGGERGRLGIARQLVSSADVLLLDEPTNHLDLETTRWLEDYLKEIDRTVLLVSHDRAF